MARESVGSALIIDIDLHYGNGTFDIVKDDGNVVFKNISAVTRQDFFDQLDESLLNASQFDIVGCSAGFDTYVKDWGGLLCTEDFRKISYRIASSNRHLPPGPVFPPLHPRICCGSCPGRPRTLFPIEEAPHQPRYGPDSRMFCPRGNGPSRVSATGETAT